MVCETYVGDIVVTAASGINVAANTALTFGAAGEALELYGATVGAAKVWRVSSNDGVGLA